jgi:hypothetical protein
MNVNNPIMKRKQPVWNSIGYVFTFQRNFLQLLQTESLERA